MINMWVECCFVVCCCFYSKEIVNGWVVDEVLILFLVILRVFIIKIKIDFCTNIRVFIFY